LSAAFQNIEIIFMRISEPNRAWQDEKYQHLLRNNPTAFAELCEGVLPHLVAFLQNHFPQQEMHNIEMVAIDVLLKLRAEPKKYNPKKLSLVGYLRMSARSDMLNLLDKNRRRDQRLTDIENMTLESEENPLEAHFALDEWLAQYTDMSRQEVLSALEAEIDPADKSILLLMLDGVRETERYAQVMDIADQDENLQKQEVKKAKDRLIKQLQRFGQRIGKNKS
jgi:RNA polymerase sigma factor (sigma-70 family)